MGELRSKLLCLLIFMPVYLFLSYTNATAAGADSLKYLGHAFVQIKTADGKNIYIDPYGVNAFTDSADVILITHEHSDHNQTNRVHAKKNCVVIHAANSIINGIYQNITVGNFSVKGVAAYNSNHPKASSVGYVVEFNGIKLYHAGDTGEITEMANLAVENLDYALLPMDGIYTMTPEQATHAASVINAKHDIPIHTMPPVDTYNNAIVARFTSPNKLIVKPGETIALTNITSINNGTETLPGSIRLNQNYPNPFNPETVIGYELPSTENITLKVYDVLGREAATLVNEKQDAGFYEIKFNAGSLSSGIYFYKITAGSFSQTKKFILMK